MKIVTASNSSSFVMHLGEVAKIVLGKEKIPGGKADGMDEKDVAELHGVPVEQIEEEVVKGLEIEKEHSPDKPIRKEISLDHEVETPEYYILLEYLEAVAEAAKDGKLVKGVDGFAHKALLKFLDETGDDWNYVLPAEYKKIMDSGKDPYFVLDVRKPEDFKKGHIPGASNVFWKDLLEMDNLEKLPKDKPILVVCYVGHTATQAMVALRLLGYDAKALKFGMGTPPDPKVKVEGWEDLGFETEK